MTSILATHAYTHRAATGMYVADNVSYRAAIPACILETPACTSAFLTEPLHLHVLSC